MTEFMASKRYASLEQFRGLLRDRVVPHSQIRRPDEKDYRGGYEGEGYARPEPVVTKS
jgi:hypothetical protein